MARVVVMLRSLGAMAALGTAACSPSESAAPGLPSTLTMPRTVATGASCVRATEVTLRDRDFAFDGTVVGLGSRPDVDGRQIRTATFDVSRWFKGSSGGQVTVRFSFQTAYDLAETFDVRVGARFLVSGDFAPGDRSMNDATARGCGFTQSLDMPGVRAWEEAFRR